MLFATIVLVVGSTLYYHVHHEKLVYMHTINLFNEAWWYAGYYLGVIIIAAIFLEKYVISKKTHLTIMAVLFAFGSNAWLGEILTPNSTDLRIIIIGLFLFATGAYIRKYNPLERISWLVFLLVMLLTYIFVWISHYNINMWNIQNYTHYSLTNRFDQTLNTYFDYNIVPIVLSMCMFELAIRIHIHSNRIINFFSRASFMVFLLHSTDFGTWIMREKDWQFSLYYSALDYCQPIIIWSFVIYGIGVIAYSLYRGILIILNKYVGYYVDSTV